jgi:hypothetical protein
MRHQVRWVKSFDWQSVLVQMTDEELEDRLFTYLCLAMKYAKLAQQQIARPRR